MVVTLEGDLLDVMVDLPCRKTTVSRVNAITQLQGRLYGLSLL